MEKKIDKDLKLIVKSSLIIFIGLFLSKVLTYVYRITIARTFGPEIYGLFSLSLMIFGFFVFFASFGFSEGLIRYLSWYRGKKQYQKIKYLFKFALSISIISSIFSGAILFFLSNYISLNVFHNPELIIFLKIFSFLIPFYLINNLFLSALQAFEKIQWYSFILNIFQNVVKVFTLFLFIFIGFKSGAIIFSYFLGIFAMFTISYFITKYKTPEIFGNSDLKNKIKSEVRKEFFSYSWPLLFFAMISQIFYWTDTFLIGYFNGAFDAGLYNAAIPIVLLMRFVPELFLRLFFPLVTKEFSRNRLKIIRQLSQQVGKWIFILNLPVFLIMFFFPDAIINVLFGAEYIIVGKSLKILAVGGFISSLIWISNNLLSVIGKSKLLLTNLLFVSTLNILLNILLIPKYGLNGAAFATTISMIVLSLILFLEVRYFLSLIPFRRKILRIFLVSFIPLFLLIYIRKFVQINLISLILLSSLFFLLYIFLIILTGCLDKNDFMILKGIKSKIMGNLF